MPDREALPKVLVVDDHDIVRLGVRHLLADRVLLSDVATLAQALSLLARQPFDLLLLDLSLGDDFSLAALPQLRQDYPQLKIIVLTSMDEELYAERALRAGANGFVMKSALSQSLLAALDTVLAGGVYVSPRLNAALLQRMAAPKGEQTQPELSLKELEVLRLLAQGLSTREMAELLNRSVKTIETHKQSLKTKLGAETPAKLLRLAVAMCADAS